MKLQAFAKMSADEKRDAVADIAAASMGPPNGQMEPINAKLAAFEARYEMTTTEMIASFKAGKLADTADIAQWLVLARARG